ncbi:unnamed protein product [Mytilus edulis]|uniref:Uncharacterized protein n=1 Tax=Mytilus edulis TaxID=6550 RepID=A0A8S3QQC5_MYTED|nr:unnamed protein product [Mytilus edulis]
MLNPTPESKLCGMAMPRSTPGIKCVMTWQYKSYTRESTVWYGNARSYTRKAEKCMWYGNARSYKKVKYPTPESKNGMAMLNLQSLLCGMAMLDPTPESKNCGMAMLDPTPESKCMWYGNAKSYTRVKCMWYGNARSYTESKMCGMAMLDPTPSKQC